MSDKLEETRKLVLLSSDDGLPDLKRARSGALGAIRSLQKGGKWPDDLDLLVVSDTYGLVEPIYTDEPPLLIPFSLAENTNWWIDFITRNLDNYISRRSYADALVMAKEEHAPALRASRNLRNLKPTWLGTAPRDVAQLKAWISGNPIATPQAGGAQLDGKARTRKQSSRVTAPSKTADVEGGTANGKLIEEAIYSDHFMLVLSKMSREEIEQVRQELDGEWARRAVRRHERPSVSNIVVKSARLPWSQRPAITLYGRLLESIGMQSVLGSINKAVAQIAVTEPGRYRDILARLPGDESEFMTDLLHLLWEASSRMDKDEIAILRAYLSDECSHSELRRMALPRNLRLEERYEVMRSVINCFSGLAQGGTLSDHRRVWIWLHEIENLLAYSEHDRWELVKGLETLAGDAPRYVTLWMNISPSSAAGMQEVQAALENKLVITHDLTAQ
ncbi:MAG TPA: hypothetical protein VGE45_07375 [Chloroflexia bacterium]